MLYGCVGHGYRYGARVRVRIRVSVRVRVRASNVCPELHFGEVYDVRTDGIHEA